MTIRGKIPTPDELLYDEYKSYLMYKELARVETVSSFKKVLRELVKHEEHDYKFWMNFAIKKELHVNPIVIFLLKMMRKILGLTFTVKFFEANERRAIRNYIAYSKLADPKMRKTIKRILRHELRHEKRLISSIQEEKVKFVSSIILGMNDGLVELTGALVGFSFAFQDSLTIALTGLITGIAATLSMAASAYMQAKHEVEHKNAKKSAVYCGASYFVVVSLLVMPFLAFSNIMTALSYMFGVALLILGSASFYTSVLFDRPFLKQFGQMLFFSLGVAAVSFCIGLLVRYIGVSRIV